MGLSLHYQVHVANCERARARELVRTLHREARALARAGSVAQVLPTSSADDDLHRFATLFVSQPDPDDPHTIRGLAVPPIEGTIFPVDLGADCELLWLGLCRYPATVRQNGRDIATRFGRGWHLHGACKTQYASQHGWEHFHRCHTTAITLVRRWAALGARVRIVDEGGWWPRRSATTLRQKLDEMNGLVAAFAGAMKDATDEGGPSIRASIFAHPRFEHLEAEGAARHGAILEAARQIVTDAARDRPPFPD
jgi:hypothetical protein